MSEITKEQLSEENMRALAQWGMVLESNGQTFISEAIRLALAELVSLRSTHAALLARAEEAERRLAEALRIALLCDECDSSGNATGRGMGGGDPSTWPCSYCKKRRIAIDAAKEKV